MPFDHRDASRAPLSASRRRFVQGLTSGVVVAGFGGALSSAVADGILRDERRGSSFELTIGSTDVDFTGVRRRAVVVDGRLPAPLLRFGEGDTVTLRVRNTLDVPSSNHWHGLVVPADMDGVPGLSFMGIPPGGAYTYRFTLNQSGTYWYHSHSRFQEQIGLYGPIIVEPRDGERFAADREHVVLLSDWTDEDPARIYATLKRQSNAFNRGKRTLGDLVRDAHDDGVRAALASRRMWNTMRMDPTDVADVSGAAYTYLMNGATPTADWTGAFARGERVRLRFINGASMTFFDVRIPGLSLRVVAADGQDVEPVSVDEFRIAPAETLDVIVTPADDRAYTIFAQSMDRSGYARGTLTPHAGLVADVPTLDARPILSMRDMMGEMDPASMQAMHGRMAAMHGDMTTHGDMTMHGAMSTMRSDTASPLAHASAEYGPGVDMRVDTPRTNLDDPGVGLRDNGRRVLTYADLRTIGAPISPTTERDVELHLTGHMERYLWSFDGKKFSDAEPLRLAHGEHVRIVLVNDTMMTHPIHLHGMWSELETPGGDFLARKHTLVVQPAQKIAYRVSADALGRWAYHCHLLYHMEAGMFREVVVA